MDVRAAVATYRPPATSCARRRRRARTPTPRRGRLSSGAGNGRHARASPILTRSVLQNGDPVDGGWNALPTLGSAGSGRASPPKRGVVLSPSCVSLVYVRTRVRCDAKACPCVSASQRLVVKVGESDNRSRGGRCGWWSGRGARACDSSSSPLHLHSPHPRESHGEGGGGPFLHGSILIRAA
ncbi:hypothetical protein DFH09DRAFT_1222698 [Mycena vulgaris]|nr:hypothetical protein DFH09DRAFT_1222698 [Mycena vulgaris]